MTGTSLGYQEDVRCSKLWGKRSQAAHNGDFSEFGARLAEGGGIGPADTCANNKLAVLAAEPPGFKPCWLRPLLWLGR